MRGGLGRDGGGEGDGGSGFDDDLQAGVHNQKNSHPQCVSVSHGF